MTTVPEDSNLLTHPLPMDVAEPDAHPQEPLEDGQPPPSTTGPEERGQSPTERDERGGQSPTERDERGGQSPTAPPSRVVVVEGRGGDYNDRDDLPHRPKRPRYATWNQRVERFDEPEYRRYTKPVKYMYDANFNNDRDTHSYRTPESDLPLRDIYNKALNKIIEPIRKLLRLVPADILTSDGDFIFLIKEIRGDLFTAALQSVIFQPMCACAHIINDTPARVDNINWEIPTDDDLSVRFQKLVKLYNFLWTYEHQHWDLLSRKYDALTLTAKDIAESSITAASYPKQTITFIYRELSHLLTLLLPMTKQTVVFSMLNNMYDYSNTLLHVIERHKREFKYIKEELETVNGRNKVLNKTLSGISTIHTHQWRPAE